jgi:hypothetical protein
MKICGPSCHRNVGHLGPGSCAANDRGLHANALKQNSCAPSFVIIVERPPARCDRGYVDETRLLADVERGGRPFPTRSARPPAHRGSIDRTAIFPPSRGSVLCAFTCANALFRDPPLAWQLCIRQCIDMLNVHNVRDLSFLRIFRRLLEKTTGVTCRQLE